MRLRNVIRLGLRQFAAGMLSVLALGILNRVMHLELGVALGGVALVIGSQEFVAPVAIPIGHCSDRRPYFGLHRTPYILAGTLVVILTVALAPWLAFLMAEQGAPPAVALGLSLFLTMGIGMHIAGTAVAVWGLEQRNVVVTPSQEAVGLRRAVALMAANSRARRFFSFMVCSMFFLFLQQVVLEPFGGRVFALEALGLLAAIGLLIGVDVAGFQTEAQRVSAPGTASPEA